MKNSRIKTTIICVIVMAAVLLLLDIFDVPGRMRLSINFDAWNVFVVFGIFAVTYAALDSRDIVRKENQEGIVEVLLASTYKEVRSYVEMMETEQFEKARAIRFPGDAILQEIKAYDKISRSPFVFEDRIFAFADEGIITATQVKDYIAVKQYYERFVTNRIVFYDVDEVIAVVKRDVIEAVEEAEAGLKEPTRRQAATVVSQI